MNRMTFVLRMILTAAACIFVAQAICISNALAQDQMSNASSLANSIAGTWHQTNDSNFYINFYAYNGKLSMEATRSSILPCQQGTVTLHQIGSRTFKGVCQHAAGVYGSDMGSVAGQSYVSIITYLINVSEDGSSLTVEMFCGGTNAPGCSSAPFSFTR